MKLTEYLNQYKPIEKVEVKQYMKPNDFRTVFHYKRLTKAIRDEFAEFVREFIDDEKSKDRNYDSYYYSKNRFFWTTGRYFYITKDFNCKNRYDDYGTVDKLFAINDSSKIKCYSNDFTINFRENLRYEQLRELFYDILFEDKYTDLTKREVGVGLNNGEYTHFYHKSVLMEGDVRDAIATHADISDFKLWVHPFGYCNFRLDEADDKMLKFDYRKRTTTIKIGKGIKKLFKVFNHETNDEQIKKISNKLSSSCEGFEFEVVTGGDISHYYHENRYDNSYSTGSLSGSCMKHDSCKYYFDVYEDNAKMLIFKNKDTDLIIGRAILWDAWDIDEDEPTKVMDRIYANEKVYLKLFDWAAENGYWRKRYDLK